jgi:hypothetical protein
MSGQDVQLGYGLFLLHHRRELVMADKVPKLDRGKLREQLLAEFDRVVEEVSDAIDDAPAGRIVRDSEEKARDVLDRFRQVAYEQALQAKVDAAEAAFPPSAQRGDRQAEAS